MEDIYYSKLVDLMHVFVYCNGYIDIFHTRNAEKGYVVHGVISKD